MAQAQPVIRALDCRHCYRKIALTPAGTWMDGDGQQECVPGIRHRPMPKI